MEHVSRIDLGDAVQSKSDVCKVLKQIIIKIEYYTGVTVKTIQCDGASEFITSGSHPKLLTDPKGIHMQHFTLHTPQEIGNAEWGTARINLGLPNSFWVEQKILHALSYHTLSEQEKPKSDIKFYLVKNRILNLYSKSTVISLDLSHVWLYTYHPYLTLMVTTSMTQ